MLSTQPPSRIFVGREHEQRLYLQHLSSVAPWVLLFTGMGGIGKTTLLQHLKDITPSGILFARLDFANGTLRLDSLNILEVLSSQLSQYCSPDPSANFQQELQSAR